MNDDEKKPLYQPVACPEVWGPAEVGGPDEYDRLRDERDMYAARADEYWRDLGEACDRAEKAEEALVTAEAAFLEHIRTIHNTWLSERNEAINLLREGFEEGTGNIWEIRVDAFLAKFPAD